MHISKHLKNHKPISVFRVWRTHLRANYAFKKMHKGDKWFLESDDPSITHIPRKNITYRNECEAWCHRHNLRYNTPVISPRRQRPLHPFDALVQLTFRSSRHSIAPSLHAHQRTLLHDAGRTNADDAPCGGQPPRDICRTFWERVVLFIDHESVVSNNYLCYNQSRLNKSKAINNRCFPFIWVLT